MNNYQQSSYGNIQLFVQSEVSAIKYVDEVIPETTWEQKISDVQEYDVSIFVIGDDWEGQFDFLKTYCEVVYLPRTDGVSTTQIKTQLSMSNFVYKKTQ